MIITWVSRLPAEVNAVLTVLASICIGREYIRQMMEPDAFEGNASDSLQWALQVLAGV